MNKLKNVVKDMRVYVAVGICLAVLVPILITLDTIQAPLSPDLPITKESPLGYTVSQILFLFPVLLILLWFHKLKNGSLQRKAFYVSCLIIFLFGSFLDFVFGFSFFHFPDPASTLEIRLPSFSFYDWKWVPEYLPIEEFMFYIFGSIFMVSLYIFGDEYWFARYNDLDYEKHARKFNKLFHLKWGSISWALLALAAAWIYKKTGNHGHEEGIPGYFTFEILLAICPTILFFEKVKQTINYRAFSFMLVTLLLISVVWEATLGVPYGWWGYKYDQMIGIDILAWANLPIEAVLLWFTAGWASVILYEFMKIHLHTIKK